MKLFRLLKQWQHVAGANPSIIDTDDRRCCCWTGRTFSGFEQY